MDSSPVTITTTAKENESDISTNNCTTTISTDSTVVPVKLTSDGLPFPHWVEKVVRDIPHKFTTMDAVYTIPRSDGRSQFTLYVGDLGSAHDGALLRSSKVSHIINTCCATCGTTPDDYTPMGREMTYSCVFTNDNFAAGKETHLDLPGSSTQNPAAQWPNALLVLRDAFERGDNAVSS
jgi:hypothetical protein